MGKEELLKEGFDYLNSFKRHRKLCEIKRDDRQYHELQMYKMIDGIELTLRAINKAVREENKNGLLS